MVLAAKSPTCGEWGKSSDEILRTIELFAEPGSVVEVRVIGFEKWGNMTGCFDDWKALARAVSAIDGKAPAVYFTLNQPNPLILARAPNRLVKSKDTTSDADIIRRRWFPIDADAAKPAGVSSPDSLHSKALAVADDVEDWLRSKGWPDPIRADSGNGGHLCYKIDLPNDKDTCAAIKGAIEAIAARFDIPEVQIDRKVFNAGRIWKLYGTMAAKGANIPGQPHRRAKILNVPDFVEAVTLDQILALVEKKPVAQTTRRDEPGKEIDVEEKCRDWGLSIAKVGPWQDATKYIIKPCPFNSSHEEGIILKHPSGAVSFNCPHNSCADNHWLQLREMFETIPARQQPIPKPKLHPPKPIERPAEIPKPRKKRIDDRINPEKDMIEMQNEASRQSRGEWVGVDLPWRRLSLRAQALLPGAVLFLAGPLKSGKSYLAMNIVADLESRGIPWKYLPLEDDRKAWAWRYLAIMAGDYRATDKDQDGAEHRQSLMAEYDEQVRAALARVSENPRVGIRDSAGEVVIPPVDYRDVVEWVRENVDKTRVLVVDPFAQVDFDHKRLLQEQDDMIRNLLGIMVGKECSLILVAHVGKRNGDKAGPMTADSVQGSINLTRLAHTTLILESHDSRESFIHRPGGLASEMQEHNRTVLIAATRNGSGNGNRVALVCDPDCPRLYEVGVIDQKETDKWNKQKARKGKNQ